MKLENSSNSYFLIFRQQSKKDETPTKNNSKKKDYYSFILFTSMLLHFCFTLYFPFKKNSHSICYFQSMIYLLNLLLKPSQLNLYKHVS